MINFQLKDHFKLTITHGSKIISWATEISYNKILEGHKSQDIKVFEQILHDDFLYIWDDRVEDRKQWLAETPKMWAESFQLQNQTLIMENEELLVTEHSHQEDGFRDIIVRIIKKGKILKQYVKR